MWICVIGLIASPLVLTYWLLRGLYVTIRALWRDAYGRKAAARKRAVRAIRAAEAAPSAEYVAAVRAVAERAAREAIKRRDPEMLMRAWQVLDDNGGDYR